MTSRGYRSCDETDTPRLWRSCTFSRRSAQSPSNVTTPLMDTTSNARISHRSSSENQFVGSVNPGQVRTASIRASTASAVLRRRGRRPSSRPFFIDVFQGVVCEQREHTRRAKRSVGKFTDRLVQEYRCEINGGRLLASCSVSVTPIVSILIDSAVPASLVLSVDYYTNRRTAPVLNGFFETV